MGNNQGRLRAAVRLGMQTEGTIQMTATMKPTITWSEFGRDGNIFAVMGAVSRAYRQAGMSAAFAPIREAVTASGSYDAALAILSDAVEFVEDEDEDEDEDEERCEWCGGVIDRPWASLCDSCAEEDEDEDDE